LQGKEPIAGKWRGECYQSHRSDWREITTRAFYNISAFRGKNTGLVNLNLFLCCCFEFIFYVSNEIGL